MVEGACRGTEVICQQKGDERNSRSEGDVVVIAPVGVVMLVQLRQRERDLE